MRIRKVSSRSLFQTRLGDSPLVAAACEAVPRVFITDDEPVKGHHTAWFAGTIVMRDYSWNLFVGDLWVLHELHHVALARQGATQQPWTQWMARVISDEFDASFLTEVLVYLREPWLREHTFGHEIWTDRILRDPSLKSRFLPGNIEHYARMLRYQVIAGGEPMDFASRQIRAYHGTNNEWAELWSQPIGREIVDHDRPAFREVEAWLELHPNPTLEQVQAWLDQNSVDSIPFPHQGRAFDAIYRRNTHLFGNHLFSR